MADNGDDIADNGANNAADAKPEVKGEKGETISLKVKDQDNNEVHFKVKLTTKFDKIFNAFCEKRGISREHTRFIFDGNRLTGQQTPKDLEMEDEDCIEVFLEQVGGRL
mmetsp:Transcript_5873/g.10176  ORF Transcript_5873/g.10176 Transcript_5873/m.10176 type:complete len:109 (-) Transcript_5873:353-679(-)|eukprot:CAMPEP_0198198448 /NCGR_PEP_ID=MMETSP1445-20131203/1917_1 /TAXON_ID=36898 /ORGANISM="Pyramimonas sp., Strain CCMP2087" /LENGTH=108 /DNA_ID=CAMNT_0043868015 /DNA_START=106 /DNA_END=435 /DNA_ORIENTATION=+